MKLGGVEKVSKRPPGFSAIWPRKELDFHKSRIPLDEGRFKATLKEI
jgi:hypothetical protein